MRLESTKPPGVSRHQGRHAVGSFQQDEKTSEDYWPSGNIFWLEGHKTQEKGIVFVEEFDLMGRRDVRITRSWEDVEWTFVNGMNKLLCINNRGEKEPYINQTRILLYTSTL